MFYIQPPKGQIALNILEGCVLTRVEYLGLLYNESTTSFNGNFEYLLENSIYDRIGHFTLRLLAFTSTDLWSYWITREILLLKHRLNHITGKELHRLFRSIIKQVKGRENRKSLIDTSLLRISTYFLQSRVFNHIVANDHAEDCERYRCKLRFELIPRLVRSKQINLDGGFGTIFCSNWKRVLLSLFETFITQERIRLKYEDIEHIVKSDVRLDSLNQRIQCEILKKGGSSCGIITVENIDTEAQKFPLCMNHLHVTLRRRHRLSHYARFYYSLFLKECGMKIEEAIKYWQEEYSKPHLCTSACTHDWQSDARKFVYSIRHLYGLEGSRRQYKSPNCSNMCKESPGPRYEGGCPFKSFDKDTLKTLLSSFLKEDEIEDYLKSISSVIPETACTSFLKMMRKTNDEGVAVNSPVQYYTIMTDPN